MCHRALTYIVERSIYFFILSNGKKKKKNPLQYLSKARFFMLRDHFGFGGVTLSSVDHGSRLRSGPILCWVMNGWSDLIVAGRRWWVDSLFLCCFLSRSNPSLNVLIIFGFVWVLVDLVVLVNLVGFGVCDWALIWVEV